MDPEVTVLRARARWHLWPAGFFPIFYCISCNLLCDETNPLSGIVRNNIAPSCNRCNPSVLAAQTSVCNDGIFRSLAVISLPRTSRPGKSKAFACEKISRGSACILQTYPDVSGRSQGHKNQKHFPWWHRNLPEPRACLHLLKQVPVQSRSRLRF